MEGRRDAPATAPRVADVDPAPPGAAPEAPPRFLAAEVALPPPAPQIVVVQPDFPHVEPHTNVQWMRAISRSEPAVRFAAAGRVVDAIANDRLLHASMRRPTAELALAALEQSDAAAGEAMFMAYTIMLEARAAYAIAASHGPAAAGILADRLRATRHPDRPMDVHAILVRHAADLAVAGGAFAGGGPAAAATAALRAAMGSTTAGGGGVGGPRHMAGLPSPPAGPTLPPRPHTRM